MTSGYSNAHTYVAGEDAGRLASTARDLGLHREEGRRPKVTWADVLFNDNTLTAATMHSVGYVAPDERVDEYGHLLSIRKRHPSNKSKQPQYDNLTDLFTQQPATKGGEVARPDTQEPFVDEEAEEVEEIIVEGGSLGAAAFGIVKGTVGPAILYLPRGFYQSGYAVAIPAMIFSTSMFVFNAYRLLDCWRVESERNAVIETRMREVQSLLKQSQEANQEQYGSTTVEQERYFTAKLLTYPELAKRALGSYSVFVEIGIALFQFGVCLTYLIFVPDNLYQCAYAIFGIHIPKTYLLLAMVVFEIPLSFIRDIRQLTTTNVIASFLIAFGLLTVLVIAFVQGTAVDPEHGDELVFVENLAALKPLTDTWFVFIGTAFFMMEGTMTLVVPLQEAVYRPEDRKRFPDMNRNVTFWICVFYIGFSAVCCAAFGSSIKTALTASLTGHLATMVQLMYSVAVMLTFPLQAFPAMEVAIRMLNKQTPVGGVDPSEGWRRNVFATVITVLLGVIAFCSIDYLGNVVSILGSLFGIPLALVFPPLMHNSLVNKDASSTSMTRCINYGVIVVGLFAMAAASYNTVVNWDSQKG